MSLETELQQFTGTERYHKMSIFPFNFTDGVAHLIEKGNCQWLVVDIFAYQDYECVKREEFQHWKLSVKDNKGTLEMFDGNKKEPIFSKKYDYTDFPMSKMELYFTNSVLLLPSEY
jgi:hypothetical protein